MQRKPTFLAVVIAVGATTGALLTPWSAAAPAGTAGSPPVTFGVPRVVDPIHAFGEPDIKVAPNGAINVSGPAGTGTQRSIWDISRDNGNSWRLVQDAPGGYNGATAAAPTKSTVAPGGGDTEIAISQHNQTFFSDLWALVCLSAGYTADSGKTVQSSPFGCSTAGADRQWEALFDPKPTDHTLSPYKGPKPLVYLSYTNEGAGSGANVDYTTIASPTNYHFGQSSDPTTGSAGGYGGSAAPGSSNDSPIIVDQHTGDLISTVTRGKGLMLAVGRPNAAAHLTFHYDSIVSGLPGNPGVLFPNVAEDSARNVYIGWVDDHTWQVYYSWASPNAAGTDWTNWHGPYQVSRRPSNTAIFSWNAAGGRGLLDFAWYGTSLTPAQLGSQGPSAQKGQAWYTYFAQIDHANTSRPHIIQVRASPHPMHYNDVCLAGLGCITQQGNRNLADFFEVTIGPDGRARIVYADTSNGLVQTGPGAVPTADHSGAPLVTVVTQNTGLNGWTGRPLRAFESTAPTSSITEPPGQALFPVLGGSPVPSANIRSVRLRTAGGMLHITVQTTSGTLAAAASAAHTGFGQLVVRWQLGNTLYHAGVEQDVAGAHTQYYAGLTSTTDLCSVSACAPHYFDYNAPPQPGTTTVAGSTFSGQGETTYTLDVPLSAIGNPRRGALLEEVEAYVFVSATSA
ncbi:MAG TPA: hypothetical protein VNE21_08765, partial [Mycobacteriales bacterium]|nr:hypothetical protein [Mycobacteriales bacterium]